MPAPVRYRKRPSRYYPNIGTGSRKIFGAMASSIRRRRTVMAARRAGMKRVPGRSLLLARQIKALVHGKTKDAADVARNTADHLATTSSCLTSSTDFSTAASGTGLLDMDGDEALINHITVSQTFDLQNEVLLDPTSTGVEVVRTLIVWFYKPLLVASAAGTLPPITEVLVTDNHASLYVPDTQNSGRFQVLYDKTDILGNNTVTVAATGSNPRLNGKIAVRRIFKVPVNKRCHFRSAGVSGTPSGHYDSDVSNGQIDRGLLVMYTISADQSNGRLLVANSTRLNYTG